MVRNPSFPQSNLLSADELFVDGVLRPLHLLHKPDAPHEAPRASEPPDPEPPESSSSSSPAITDSAATTSFSASKRWRDIFRKGEKKAEENKSSEDKEKEKKKKKKKEKKKSGSGASAAELNINIWPFSRSRSAGNASTRPKLFTGAPGSTRKVNSAPCSRSNSAGESKSRKWPSSPGRAGVHVGRSSPVWQVRRGGSASWKGSSEPMVLNAKGPKKETHTTRRSKVAAIASSAGGGGGSGSAKARVLNINVPVFVGYRHNLSCRSDEKSATGVGGGGSAADGGAGNAVGSGARFGNAIASWNVMLLCVFYCKMYYQNV
ncbi:proteoglycan 4-like [Senna tora]|uniref:Proteoglycan 4-like n=1 Tax=Senna tora TaxID=362788 RepID=A0A835CGD6_9FABA|nr:proteoglycan 4-like [Senna tora]